VLQSESWQGSLRLGLLVLLCSDEAAAGPLLAETLALDAERLHACQNKMQHLLVVVASLLIVQQVCIGLLTSGLVLKDSTL
jgi:T-complex protein 11